MKDRIYKGLAGILVLLLAALLLAACGGGEEPVPTGIRVIVPTPSPPGERTPTPAPATATPTPTPSPTPVNPCFPNPDPADRKVLQVVQPQAQARVGVPFHVSGWGSTIGENNRGVVIGLVDSRQTVLQVLDVPPQPRTYRVPPAGLEITDHTRPFGADIVISNVREPLPVCIWVYLDTNDEGQPRTVVQVPVLVAP